jgi:hypothetical protein
LPRPARLWAIVAREHDYSVLANAERIDCIQDFTDVRVHLREGVRKFTKAGLTNELGIRQRREVHQREWHVGVERFTRAHAARHEIDRPAGDLRIN